MTSQQEQVKGRRAENIRLGLPGRALPLVAMTAFFAALALDIAVPAFVLAAMGMARWVVTSGDKPFLDGRTA